MQGNHVPARLREVFDEVETDKAGTARDESGLVRHDLFFLALPPRRSQTDGERRGLNG